MHDWLVAWRGGEQVLQALATLFPSADIYTLVADQASLPPGLQGRTIRSSWLQHLPVRGHFRWGLPLFPWTIEQFRFDQYDLVVSISHTVAKGIKTGTVPHLCYCLTPMRFAWVCPETYFGSAMRTRWSPQRAVIEYLKQWDVRASDRPTAFIAISRTIQARIRECYQREASVIYPPVDCDRFALIRRDARDYYLIVAALVPYKRTDLAIDAFNRMHKPLAIVGTGPEEHRLRHRAGPTIRFLGRQSLPQLANWYAGARALIYPQEEDFGIAAVEAQAAGCPVIAYGRGGATETVIHEATGLHFQEQTTNALIEVVTHFERRSFEPERLRRHARQFDRRQFEQAFRGVTAAMLEGKPLR